MTKKQSTAIFIIICVVLVSVAAVYMRIKYPIVKNAQIQKNENITVSYPGTGNSLELPFVVKGTARVFENSVAIKLVDRMTGMVIFEDSAMADAPDVGQFGPFSKQIDYLLSKPSSPEVDLHVFWYSPKDGAAIDPVIIPINLKTDDTREIAIFLSPAEISPAGQCDSVVPSPRTVPNISGTRNEETIVAQKALEFLLDGPTFTEQSKGFTTQINSGVAIEDFAIKDGTATVNFSKNLEQGVAGSCRVLSIRSQIEQTLKQFPYIQNVVIQVDGKIDDVLQP